MSTNKVQKMVTVTKSDGTTFQRKQWVNADEANRQESLKSSTAPAGISEPLLRDFEPVDRAEAIVQYLENDADIELLTAQLDVTNREMENPYLLPVTSGTDVQVTLKDGSKHNATRTEVGTLVDHSNNEIDTNDVASFHFQSADSEIGLLEMQHRVLQHEASILLDKTDAIQNAVNESITDARKNSFSLRSTLPGNAANERVLAGIALGANKDGTRSYRFAVTGDGAITKANDRGILEPLPVDGSADQSDWSRNEKQTYAALVEHREAIVSGIENELRFHETRRAGNILAEEYRRQTGIYL